MSEVLTQEVRPLGPKHAGSALQQCPTGHDLPLPLQDGHWLSPQSLTPSDLA